jgi:hypothetical protein
LKSAKPPLNTPPRRQRRKRNFGDDFATPCILLNAQLHVTAEVDLPIHHTIVGAITKIVDRRMKQSRPVAA